MNTISRIGTLISIEDQLWKVHLTLIDNADQQVKIYDKLLKTIMNNDQNEAAVSFTVVLNNKAAAHASLKSCEATLTFIENLLLPHDPLLVILYNNVGAANRLLGKLPSAMAYYEKAMEIIQKFLSNDSAKLATTYVNIGEIYNQWGRDSIARTFHEKAFSHYLTILSSIHPHLGTCYLRIDYLYEMMGNDTDALSNYQTALKIEQRSLPIDHPDIANTYRAISSIH